MKSLFKKPARITFLLVFFALGLMSFKSNNPDESMRRFWGSETNCVESYGNGGSCCTTTTCYTTYYVFWIQTSSELTSITIDCSGCQ